MSKRISLSPRALLACLFASVALYACSGDDGDDPEGGSGGTAGSSGGSSGSGGASGTSGGSGASGASGGSGGASGASGGVGATGGSGGTEADGGDTDSGTDSGVPVDQFACVAPVPATEYGEECPGDDPVALQLIPLRTDFTIEQSPILVTAAPGDESRIFVVMRNGEVLILDPEDGTTVGTFMTLSDRVTAATDSGGEYGLLGLAFHPNYPEDPRVFVNYTIDPGEEDSPLETLISSFEVSDNPNEIDLDSEQVLLRYLQPQRNHNGGMLAFGKDNCLYIGAGDGGMGNDVGPGHSAGGNGQDLSKPLGKILRIDPDNAEQRAPGNPDGPEYLHIWDYGVRNPWRFSFDRETGDLYIGEVGQDAREEVSIAPRGVGDHNFGWPIAEGAACLGGGNGCDLTGLVPPAVDYEHVPGDQSENCVIGGYVYRGSAIPSLQGWYLFGDSGGGRRIRAFVWDGETSCDTPIKLSERDGLTVNERITSFGEDAAGELYVTTSRGVYRFAEAE